jgi:hypothetical protein
VTSAHIYSLQLQAPGAPPAAALTAVASALCSQTRALAFDASARGEQHAPP